MTALPAGASSSDGRRFISPQLVIYGAAWRREAGVRGTGPPELVHCPAPSCFTTQRAGLANLRWQTVTYITPRLADEDWLCFKGSVHTQSIFGKFSTQRQGISFSPLLLLCRFDLSCFVLFVLSHAYLSLLAPSPPPLPPPLLSPPCLLLSVCGCNVK